LLTSTAKFDLCLQKDDDDAPITAAEAADAPEANQAGEVQEMKANEQSRVSVFIYVLFFTLVQWHCFFIFV